MIGAKVADCLPLLTTAEYQVVGIGEVQTLHPIQGDSATTSVKFATHFCLSTKHLDRMKEDFQSKKIAFFNSSGERDKENLRSIDNVKQCTFKTPTDIGSSLTTITRTRCVFSSFMAGFALLSCGFDFTFAIFALLSNTAQPRRPAAAARVNRRVSSANNPGAPTPLAWLSGSTPPLFKAAVMASRLVYGCL